MITVIRKRLIQSKAYKVIVWGMVIVLSASFGLPGLMSRNSNSGEWVATVNGEEIGYHDYVRQVMNQETFIHMFRKYYGSHADDLLQAMGFSSDPKTLAMQTLVRNTLMNQAGTKMGMAIHADFLQEKLSDPMFIQQELSDLIPPTIVDQHGINNEEFKKYLNRMHLSFADFEEAVYRALERSLVKEIALPTAYVPRFESENFCQLEYGSKKFAILACPLERFIEQAKKSRVTDQALQQFFTLENEKSKRYFVPEKRSGTVWKFDARSFGNNVDHQAIIDYYESHKKDEFVAAPATMEMRRILMVVPSDADAQAVYKKAVNLHAELVKNPASFAQKAKELSEDSLSAARGGLMAPFKRGTQEEIIEKTAYALKDGAISGVLQTSRGFEIIQRVRKMAAVYKKLAEVESQVRDMVLRQQFGDQFTQLMTSCCKDSDRARLATIIEQKKPKATELSNVAYDKSKTTDLLFNLSENSYGFYVEGGYGYLVKTGSIQKGHTPSLASIKSRVEQDYYQEQARGLMHQNFAKMCDALTTQSLEAVAKEFGATLEISQGVRKSETGKIAALRAKGLPVEKMLQMEKEGLCLTHDHKDMGFLVQLHRLEGLDKEFLDKQRADIEQELAREKGRLSLVSFVASLHRTATIRQNDSLLHS